MAGAAAGGGAAPPAVVRLRAPGRPGAGPFCRGVAHCIAYDTIRQQGYSTHGAVGCSRGGGGGATVPYTVGRVLGAWCCGFLSLRGVAWADLRWLERARAKVGGCKGCRACVVCGTGRWSPRMRMGQGMRLLLRDGDGTGRRPGRRFGAVRLGGLARVQPGQTAIGLCCCRTEGAPGSLYAAKPACQHCINFPAPARYSQARTQYAGRRDPAHLLDCLRLGWFWPIVSA